LSWETGSASSRKRDQKALELVDSRTFGTGVLYLTYRPADEW
jgi:hypothetical protein